MILIKTKSVPVGNLSTIESNDVLNGTTLVRLTSLTYMYRNPATFRISL